MRKQKRKYHLDEIDVSYCEAPAAQPLLYSPRAACVKVRSIVINPVQGTPYSAIICHFDPLSSRLTPHSVSRYIKALANTDLSTIASVT